MGAANPVAAADRIVAIAKEKRIKIKVAAVTGDDVLNNLSPTKQSLKPDRRYHPMEKFFRRMLISVPKELLMR